MVAAQSSLAVVLVFFAVVASAFVKATDDGHTGLMKGSYAAFHAAALTFVARAVS